MRKFCAFAFACAAVLPTARAEIVSTDTANVLSDIRGSIALSFDSEGGFTQVFELAQTGDASMNVFGDGTSYLSGLRLVEPFSRESAGTLDIRGHGRYEVDGSYTYDACLTARTPVGTFAWQMVLHRVGEVVADPGFGTYVSSDGPVAVRNDNVAVVVEVLLQLPGLLDAAEEVTAVKQETLPPRSLAGLFEPLSNALGSNSHAFGNSAGGMRNAGGVIGGGGSTGGGGMGGGGSGGSGGTPTGGSSGGPNVVFIPNGDSNPAAGTPAGPSGTGPTGGGPSGGGPSGNGPGPDEVAGGPGDDPFGNPGDNPGGNPGGGGGFPEDDIPEGTQGGGSGGGGGGFPGGNINPVPEPASVAVWGILGAGFVLLRQRRFLG